MSSPEPTPAVSVKLSLGRAAISEGALKCLGMMTESIEMRRLRIVTQTDADYYWGPICHEPNPQSDPQPADE